MPMAKSLKFDSQLYRSVGLCPSFQTERSTMRPNTNRRVPHLSTKNSRVSRQCSRRPGSVGEHVKLCSDQTLTLLGK